MIYIVEHLSPILSHILESIRKLNRYNVVAFWPYSCPRGHVSAKLDAYLEAKLVVMCRSRNSTLNIILLYYFLLLLLLYYFSKTGNGSRIHISIFFKYIICIVFYFLEIQFSLHSFTFLELYFWSLYFNLQVKRDLRFWSL